MSIVAELDVTSSVWTTWPCVRAVATTFRTASLNEVSELPTNSTNFTTAPSLPALAPSSAFSDAFVFGCTVSPRSGLDVTVLELAGSPREERFDVGVSGPPLSHELVRQVPDRVAIDLATDALDRLVLEHACALHLGVARFRFAHGSSMPSVRRSKPPRGGCSPCSVGTATAKGIARREQIVIG
jgi:hypothetical protein